MNNEYKTHKIDDLLPADTIHVMYEAIRDAYNEQRNTALSTTGFLKHIMGLKVDEDYSREEGFLDLLYYMSTHRSISKDTGKNISYLTNTIAEDLSSKTGNPVNKILNSRKLPSQKKEEKHRAELENLI